LGHGDARVRGAVEQVLERGAACSYENELHSELARQLCAIIPCCELVRFTGSGTEATMHCLRLARAYTGRARILKFEGNFHGYHDQVMFGISTPLDRLGPESSPTLHPGSSGIAPKIEENLVVVPFNRPDLLESALARHGRELAAVICEPIYYNAGCVVPTREFVRCLQDETRRHGVLLIFDEVLSGFRMCVGGAQEYLGVKPDLCTLGKALGGGMPISAFGGRRDIMDHLMPKGDCQHSGTYNGHVICVAAALAAVKAYQEPGFYEHIATLGERLYTGLQRLFDDRGVTARVQGLGARFGIYFGIREPVTNYRDALHHQRERMLDFIAAAIQHGVYFHDYGGGACHHGFCAAMSATDVDETLERLDEAVNLMHL
jgi:glutamate-1-semialdehyde 2,1-aminomutase